MANKNKKNENAPFTIVLRAVAVVGVHGACYRRREILALGLKLCVFSS